MATYSVNPAAVARARALIDARQYVLDSDWGAAQPRADAENDYLERHSWDEYAAWHLGLTDGANEQSCAPCRMVGFTPVFTDTYEKADRGHEECSCRSEGSSVRSSSAVRLSRRASRV